MKLLLNQFYGVTVPPCVDSNCHAPSINNNVTVSPSFDNVIVVPHGGAVSGVISGVPAAPPSVFQINILSCPAAPSGKVKV